MLGFKPIGDKSLGALPGLDGFLIQSVASSLGTSEGLVAGVGVFPAVASASGLSGEDVTLAIKAYANGVSSGVSTAHAYRVVVAYSVAAAIGGSAVTSSAIGTVNAIGFSIGGSYAHALSGSKTRSHGSSYAAAKPYLFYLVSETVCVPCEDRNLVVGCKR